MIIARDYSELFYVVHHAMKKPLYIYFDYLIIGRNAKQLEGMNPGKLSSRIALELQRIRSGRLIFIKPISISRVGAIVGAADIGEFNVTIF